jgi:hypothetical protein
MKCIVGFIARMRIHSGGQAQDQSKKDPLSSCTLISSSLAFLSSLSLSDPPFSSARTRIHSCTSRTSLSPTNRGTSSAAALRSENPSARLGRSVRAAASATMSRSPSGAGCHAGGDGVSSPMLSGEAASGWRTRARARKAGANAARLAFWSVRWEYDRTTSSGSCGGACRISSARRRSVGSGNPFRAGGGWRCDSCGSVIGRATYLRCRCS